MIENNPTNVSSAFEILLEEVEACSKATPLADSGKLRL